MFNCIFLGSIVEPHSQFRIKKALDFEIFFSVIFFEMGLFFTIKVSSSVIIEGSGKNYFGRF